MAVQLILKNSSIEDRRPTAAQLANGEISLNYNEAGPFVACKDTAGNIQSLGGVKFASDAPADPPIGAWWFSTAFSSLFVYDGTTWLAVGGGGGGGGGSIDAVLGGEGIDTTVAGTVVTVEVELAEGRDGLEFDADRLKATTASKTAFGSVSVGDNIDVSAAGEISIPLATETVPGIVKIGNGIDVDINGTISVDIPQTLNYRGSCLLTNSPTGQINPNPPVLGDAYINGADTSSINAGWTGLSGSSAAGDLVVWDGAEWELIGTGGTAYWDRTGTILSPSNAGDKAQTASTVDSDPDATLVTKDYVEDQRVTTSDTAPVAADSRDGDLWWNTNDGRLYVYYEDADSSQWVDASPDSQVSSEYWKRIAGPYLAPDNDGDGIDVGDGKIQLNADGSGVFRDSLNVGTSGGNYGVVAAADTAATGTRAAVHAKNRTNGGWNYVGISHVSDDVTFSVDTHGNTKIGGLPAAPNITLAANGTIRGQVAIIDRDIIGSPVTLMDLKQQGVHKFAFTDEALYIGDKPPSSSGSPNITLGANGSITAAGDVKIGTLPSAPNIELLSDGRIVSNISGGSSFGVYKNNSISPYVLIQRNGNNTSTERLFVLATADYPTDRTSNDRADDGIFNISADGSIYSAGTSDNYFAGDLLVGGTTASPNINLLSTGEAHFAGPVGIGTDAPQAKLDVAGRIQSSGGVTGVSRSFVSSGSVDENTTDFRSFLSANSFTGTGTIPFATHFQAQPSRPPSTLTITEQSGFYAGSNLAADTVTTAYGFYSNLTSGPNNNYNFYAAGTALNYFAGVTRVGGLASYSPNPGYNNTDTGFVAAAFADKTKGTVLYVSRDGGICSSFNSNTVGSLMEFRSSGVNAGYLSTTSDTGILLVSNSSTGPVIVQNSDARVKTLTPFSGNAADTIKSLSPGLNGFIAHELQAHVSDAVTGTQNATEAIGTLTDYDGTVIETAVVEPSAEDLTYTEEVETDGVSTATVRTRSWTATGTRPVYQGVDQTKLIPLLTKALQEALTEIDNLKARLDAAGV